MKIAWTAALDAELARHWREGKLSGRQIADTMNLPSKNSAIGRVHRLKLPKRVASNVVKVIGPLPTAKLDSERRRQLRVRDARRKKPPPTPYIILNNLAARKRDPKLPAFAEDFKSPGIPFLQIERLQCHYVLGEPVANALMCGAPTDGGRYCAHHHDRCYVAVHNVNRQKSKPESRLAVQGE